MLTCSRTASDSTGWAIGYTIAIVVVLVVVALVVPILLLAHSIGKRGEQINDSPRVGDEHRRARGAAHHDRPRPRSSSPGSSAAATRLGG